jgi:tetratricopeptide (TPR) repeat protein
MLSDPNDPIGQERLLEQSIAARPLDCGCQHLLYGIVLENVGRFSDAAEEFRRATDMLALDENSQFNLADSLTVIGRPDEAKAHFDASNDLAADPDWAVANAVFEAPETQDYLTAIQGLQNPNVQMPKAQRAAFLEGFHALMSADKAAKERAVQTLLALPTDEQDPCTVKLLGALGAHHEALGMLANRIGSRLDWPSMLRYPSMRGALDDPAFPAVAQRLGLMRYWKTTHTRPDICSAKNSPPFCRMI